jgi:hypothetical protein
MSLKKAQLLIIQLTSIPSFITSHRHRHRFVTSHHHHHHHRHRREGTSEIQ